MHNLAANRRDEYDSFKWAARGDCYELTLREREGGEGTFNMTVEFELR